MKKERKLFNFIILGLLTAFLVGVPLFTSIVKGDEVCDNNGWASYDWVYSASYDPVKTKIDSCPGCSISFPVPHGDSDDDFTTTTIQISDGNKTINVTICSNRLREAYPGLAASECNVYDDEFPTPLTADGEQNANYHGEAIAYLSDIWGDGQFNGDNPLAKSISEVWCGGTTDMTKCTEEVFKMMEDGGYLSEEIYPGFAIQNGSSFSLVDARKGMSCEDLNKLLGYPTENGIKNGMACAVFKACVADHTYGETKKGDDGVCNALPDLETGTCEEFGDCCECVYECLEDSDSDECKECRSLYCSIDTPPKSKTCPNGNPIPSQCKDKCDDPESTKCDKCLEQYCNIDYKCSGPKQCGDECYSNEEWPADIIGQYSCGQNYEGTYYTKGETICEDAVVMYEEKISINNIPSRFGNTLYAGQGFNWGNGVVETITKKTRVYGSMNIISSKNILINENENLKNENDCIEKEIMNLNYQIESCKENENCTLLGYYESQLSEKNAKKTENNAKIKQNEQKIKEKDSCLKKIADFKTTSTVKTNVLKPSSLTMSIGNYTQRGNSVKAVEKNNGELLFELPEDMTNYYLNKYVFFIPSNITSVSNGNVEAVYSTTKFQMNITCPISLKNQLLCNEDDDCGNGGLNVIYRPISLSNPFPNIITDGIRDTVGFWDSQTMNAFITTNRNVDTYEVYNQQPMYSITLTPSVIKKIREYNKTNSLNDFDMECTDGLYCHSNFLENYEEIFDLNSSCAYNVSASDWYACDDEIVGNTRDQMLKKLKNKG